MTEGIKNLFIFIDYLHTQMQYFETKKPLIDKVDNLLAQRNSLKPRLNYKDKIVFDKLKPQIENELSTLEIEVINIIKSKIVELDIADISTPIININAQSDLYRFQLNFTEVDVDLIQIAKRKYIEFRKTNNHSFYMGFFFSDLDRCLYEFFDFFKECDEVEDIAEKTVKVNSWEQVAEYLSTGTVACMSSKENGLSLRECLLV